MLLLSTADNCYFNHSKTSNDNDKTCDDDDDDDM